MGLLVSWGPQPGIEPGPQAAKAGNTNHEPTRELPEGVEGTAFELRSK